MKKITYHEPVVLVLNLTVETMLCSSPGDLNITDPVDPWTSSVLDLPTNIGGIPFSF